MDFDGVDINFLNGEEILSLTEDIVEMTPGGGILAANLDDLSDNDVLSMYDDVLETDNSDYIATGTYTGYSHSGDYNCYANYQNDTYPNSYIHVYCTYHYSQDDTNEAVYCSFQVYNDITGSAYLTTSGYSYSSSRSRMSWRGSSISDSAMYTAFYACKYK